MRFETTKATAPGPARANENELEPAATTGPGPETTMLPFVPNVHEVPVAALVPGTACRPSRTGNTASVRKAAVSTPTTTAR